MRSDPLWPSVTYPTQPIPETRATARPGFAEVVVADGAVGGRYDQGAAGTETAERDEGDGRFVRAQEPDPVSSTAGQSAVRPGSTRLSGPPCKEAAAGEPGCPP